MLKVLLHQDCAVWLLGWERVHLYWIHTCSWMYLPSAARHGVDTCGTSTCWALPCCPSPAWRQGSDGEGEDSCLSICLGCLRAQLCGVSVPYPVRVLRASLQGRERRAAARLCSALLLSISTGSGNEFLMNSAFHLLLVVLFLHFRAPDAPSKRNEGGASLVLWEAEMLRRSHLRTVLWARPRR